MDWKENWNRQLLILGHGAVTGFPDVKYWKHFTYLMEMVYGYANYLCIKEMITNLVTKPTGPRSLSSPTWEE